MNFISYETKLDLFFGFLLFLFQFVILLFDSFFEINYKFFLTLQVLVVPFVYFTYVLFVKDYLKHKFSLKLSKVKRELSISLRALYKRDLENKYLLSKLSNVERLEFLNTFYDE